MALKIFESCNLGVGKSPDGKGVHIMVQDIDSQERYLIPMDMDIGLQIADGIRKEASGLEVVQDMPKSKPVFPDHKPKGA